MLKPKTHYKYRKTIRHKSEVAKYKNKTCRILEIVNKTIVSFNHKTQIHPTSHNISFTTYYIN